MVPINNIYFLCWYKIRLFVTFYEKDWTAILQALVNANLDQYFDCQLQQEAAVKSQGSTRLVTFSVIPIKLEDL